MTVHYDYKTIRDAFTSAASPVVAKAAFDLVRASIQEGHTAKIALEGGTEVRFSNVADFDKWVKKTFYNEEE